MNKPFVLERYEMIRVLGRGSEGETYLMRHKTLNVERAVKKINRNSLIAIPLEAHILRSLNHPGIPIIYDLEQDSQYFYIIMEYVNGMTLADYMKNHRIRDPFLMLTYGIQLCDILEYLHSRHPEPILHLDLQPANLLICNGQLKLIDFGNAFGLSSSLEPSRDYRGTRGFAAPEAYSHRPMDVASDLYSTGKLLYYMLTGEVLYDTSGSITAICFERLSRLLSRPELGELLGEIICKCLYPTPTLRYKDARTLMVQLEMLLQRMKEMSHETLTPLSFSPKKRLSIAVCGSTPGIGTTHVSIALTAVLNRRKQPAIYIEEHESQMLYRLKEADSKVCERNGIYSYGSIPMTYYSPGVTDPVICDEQIRIMDYGVCNFEVANQIREKADICLLISGMMSWQTILFREALSMLPANNILLFNHGDQKMFQQICRSFGNLDKKRMMRLPQIPNPFSPSHECDHFFDQLFSILNLD